MLRIGFENSMCQVEQNVRGQKVQADRKVIVPPTIHRQASFRFTRVGKVGRSTRKISGAKCGLQTTTFTQDPIFYTTIIKTMYVVHIYINIHIYIHI